MMQKYLIRLTTYPTSQHPNRYLNVVTDRIEWVMEQYQRNRHPFEWKAIEINPADEDAVAVCEEIKYKYDDKV